VVVTVFEVTPPVTVAVFNFVLVVVGVTPMVTVVLVPAGTVPMVQVTVPPRSHSRGWRGGPG
jgi:hypothetical protein